ncbi:MAG: hypothetical protein M3R38_01785 [Actinomycetota bacterium]|nr:hypothetical protein [Actinomycetota bacterium]
MSDKAGRIVAEYEDYSVWETPLSEPRYFRPAVDGRWYGFAYSYRFNVPTYEQAILEPEWELFT